MKNRYLLLLISALVSLAASSYAANDPLSGYCGRKKQLNVDSTNLQWSVDLTQHTLTITGSGQMKDYDLDTKAPWFTWYNDIQTVILPNGITTIGAYAFYYCNHVENINFPESLEQICTYAFNYCSGLKTIRFGNNVRNINDNAFASCTKIEEIDFGLSPTTIGYYAFSPASSLVTIKAKKIKSIGSYAFSSCQKLVNLQLGDSLKTIDYCAFSGCYVLPAVHLPASLTYMLANSFRYCYALDTITVHPDNTVYDSRNNCNAVISTANKTLVLGCCKTVIPNEITTIGENAFYECRRLQSITFPTGLKQIQSYAFYNCDSLTTLTLPEGLQGLYDKAFSDCDRLQSVNLPNSLNTVGCGVFNNCKALTTPVYNDNWFAYMPANYEGGYIIPESLQHLACEAFYNCTKLTSVLIPERVKAIANYTFHNCQSLNAIHIPDSVTSIGQYAFQYCAKLTAITFPANLTGFGGNMLRGCNQLSTINWNVRKYQNIDVSYTWADPFNGVRSQIKSMSFGDSVQIVPANLCYEMDKLTSLSLGCNITKIGDNAFYGCTNIKSIHWNLRTCTDPDIYTQAPFYSLHDSITTFTFGDSVRHIPAYLCHSMSRLHQVHIPEYVSSIGKYAFRYLGELDSISVAAGNSYYDSRNDCNALIESASDILLLGCYKTQIPNDITGVGECAFRNVRNYTSVSLPENVTFVGKEAFNGCHELQELSLPENLVTIDDYAFQDCDSMHFLTIPQNVEQIGFRAFAHCSGLEDINCRAVTPPTIDATSFSGTTCPIHVPCAGIAEYRSTAIWSDFGSRLTGEALYTLTVQPNEFAYGVVSILQKPDCEHDAIIEAVPSRGYDFIAWQTEEGTILSTEAHYEFTVDQDLNLIAVFERRTEGLEAVQADETAIWYDMMGHRVTEPTSGVYIVVTGHSTHKIVLP